MGEFPIVADVARIPGSVTAIVSLLTSAASFHS